MTNTVKFSLPADLFAALDFAAAAKGKSRSEYARDATVVYMTKYPPKGVIADIVLLRGNDPKNLTAESNTDVGSDQQIT